MSVKDRIFLGVWLTIITLVLVTPALTGLVGISVSMVLTLVMGIYLTFRSGLGIWFSGKLPLFLVGASALIFVAFVVTMREPDELMFLLNFMGILMGPPLLVLSRRFSGMEWTKRIILMAACGALLTFAIALWDVLVVERARAQGFYLGGSNQFGQFALLYGTICLGGMMVWRQTGMRVVLAIAAALSVVAIILAGSRGVAFAAVPTAIIAAWFAIAGQFHGRRVLAVALLVGVAIASTVVAAALSDRSSNRIFSVFEQVQTAFADGYSEDSNIQIRFVLYQSAWASFQSAPVFGVGWVPSLEAGNKAVDADPHLPRVVKRKDYPLLHNDFLGFAASMGLVGLTAFALLVAAPWLGVGPPDDLRRFRLYLLVTMVSIFHVFAITDVSLTVGGGIAAYIVMTALISCTFRISDKPDQATA